jgi:hypothetical protein
MDRTVRAPHEQCDALTVVREARVVAVTAAKGDTIRGRSCGTTKSRA